MMAADAWIDAWIVVLAGLKVAAWFSPAVIVAIIAGRIVR